MSRGDLVSADGRGCDWCSAIATEGRVVRGSLTGKSAGALKAYACGEHRHLLEPAVTRGSKGGGK